MTKKVFAILMAVMMVMATSVVAFAAAPTVDGSLSASIEMGVTVDTPADVRPTYKGIQIVWQESENGSVSIMPSHKQLVWSTTEFEWVESDIVVPAQVIGDIELPLLELDITNVSSPAAWSATGPLTAQVAAGSYGPTNSEVSALGGQDFVAALTGDFSASSVTQNGGGTAGVDFFNCGDAFEDYITSANILAYLASHDVGDSGIPITMSITLTSLE